MHIPRNSSYVMRKTAEECCELAAELLKSANKGDYSKKRMKRIENEYSDVVKCFEHLKKVLNKDGLLDLDQPTK